ncbi:MAG: transglutaminase-like domain-containing protein [Treponema sp.]|nr:transglutaminase-like domain-containing protein [Treponema sp.]
MKLKTYLIMVFAVFGFLSCVTLSSSGSTEVRQPAEQRASSPESGRNAAASTEVKNTNERSTAPSAVTVWPLAVRMAEAKIKRFVTTPEQMLEMARERSIGTWDSVELVNTRELADGRIEYTLLYSVDQRTRVYTTNTTNTINGPKNITVAMFGSIVGPNENLSAYDAQVLINQCKEWYTNDRDYRRIIDILEEEVITKLQYDWASYLSGRYPSYQDAVRAGLGVCDVYARLTREVLTRAGYRVEMWSSSSGNHAWNHVILSNGRTLYIDATWYDNNYDNHPTQHSPDSYSPWYITYDKNLFERGLKGTIRMHGAWGDARRID